MNQDKRIKSFIALIESIIKYFKWIMLVVVLLVVASGMYTVQSNEVAIVLRLGRLVGATPSQQIKGPGLHFAFPFFVDEVIKVPVQMIHEREISTHYSTSLLSPMIGDSGYILTGDSNIVLLRAVVRYQITDAPSYVLFTNQTEEIIDRVTSSELTRLITTMEIDNVLTTGRTELGQSIIQKTQNELDALGMGIRVMSIELTDIMPPLEVIEDFEEVRSASVRRETSMQQAREQAEILTLEAQAQANVIVHEAFNLQNEKMRVAFSDIAQFNGLLESYQSDRQMVQMGVFRNRVSALLGRFGSTIIVPEGADVPIIQLP